MRRAQELQRRSDAALARVAETMEASQYRMEQARSHVESSQARLTRIHGSDPESLILTPIWTADDIPATAGTAGPLPSRKPGPGGAAEARNKKPRPAPDLNST
jgi:hypothetical protein